MWRIKLILFLFLLINCRTEVSEELICKETSKGCFCCKKFGHNCDFGSSATAFTFMPCEVADELRIRIEPMGGKYGSVPGK